MTSTLLKDGRGGGGGGGVGVREWFVRYGVYVDAGTTALLMGVAGICTLTQHPFKRDFRLDDIEISYKEESDTFNNTVLIVISLSIPLLFFIVVHFILRSRGVYRPHERLAFRLFGLLQCFALTFAYTELLKMTVGRLRPDFLDRCQPDPVTLLCTGDESVVDEGRKSFPSGHCTTIASMMMYVTLYLAFEMHTMTQKSSKDEAARFSRVIVALSPLMLMAVVAASRKWDNRHHDEDIFAGCLIGVVSALIIFETHHQHGHPAEELSHAHSINDVTAGRLRDTSTLLP